MNLGICNSFLAELWGLRLGTQVARDPNLHDVIFEMNSFSVVCMVIEKQIKSQHYISMVHYISS